MELFNSEFDASDDGRLMQGVLPVRGESEMNLGPPEVRNERQREEDGKEPQFRWSVAEV